MFWGCSFRQRTYVAQGLVKRVLNETCFQYKSPLVSQVGLHKGDMECLLSSALIYDLFIVVCVSVYLGHTHCVYCSSNATNNLTSKKKKVCSLSYRHVETRRRKGCKRCDLFYGGEWDKPPWSGEIWWISKWLSLKWKTAVFCWCPIGEHSSVYFCVLNRLIPLRLDLQTSNKLFQCTCNQTQMAGKAFDIRLIPEFHGVSFDYTVSEWLEQVELVCKKCSVDNIERVLPLRLRGGALLVYQRLTRDQREDLQQVKQALLVAFVLDPFVAFDTFVLHRLCPGENSGRIFGWPTGTSSSDRRKHLWPTAQLRFRVRTFRSS